MGWACRRVGGRQLGTNLGAVVALTLIVLFSAGVLMLFAPLVQEQVQALGQLDTAQLTQHWNEALALVDAWTAGIDLSGEGMQNSAYLAEQAMDLVQLHNASALFSGLLSSIGNVFVTGFSVLFMAFFLMREPTLFRDLMLTLTPESKRAAMARILERSGHMLTWYFGGLVIQVLIVTLVIGLGLTFLGIPHGWLLGLLAGLCNLIPYLGPLLGAGVGAIVMISSGVNWHDFAGPWVHISQPKPWTTCSRSRSFLPNACSPIPWEIFVVISVAGSLAGPAGMVLAIPTYTLFRIVATEFFQEFPWIQALTQSMSAREQADG